MRGKRHQAGDEACCDRSAHRVLGAVLSSAVDRAAVEEKDVACLHFRRNGHFRGHFLVPVIPLVTAGDHAGSADLIGEINQRQHHVAQHARLFLAEFVEKGELLIAVQHLRRLARHQSHTLAAHDAHLFTSLAHHSLHIGQDGRIADHVVAKGLALGIDVGDALRLVAKEAIERIVLTNQFAGGLLIGEGFVHLGVDGGNLLGVEHALDHHAAITADDLKQFFRRNAERNAGKNRLFKCNGVRHGIHPFVNRNRKFDGLTIALSRSNE